MNEHDELLCIAQGNVRLTINLEGARARAVGAHRRKCRNHAFDMRVLEHIAYFSQIEPSRGFRQNIGAVLRDCQDEFAFADA